jgi:hypothetical protein
MKDFFDFSERYGTRPGGYRDLMSRRVRHVLLVASMYESFILAEDGHLHERVLGKFLEEGPRDPPDLTRVSSGREAIRLFQEGHRPLDLVISSPHVGDMSAGELADALRRAGVEVPVAVLAYDRETLQRHHEEAEREGVLGAFLYQGDARILMAIVRTVEDRLNVARDTEIGVPVFLVVEDSVRFYSSFLPVIYAEVQRLSESVQFEAGNRLQRIMRVRARPKILLATTWERAMADFRAYRHAVMGIFSDMRFPRQGAPDPDAGRALVGAVRELEPEVPIALQSSWEENRRVAEELEVGFLLKGSPDFLHQLRRYLSEHLFFGDFVFRDPEGREIARARDMRELVEALQTVPPESLAYHALRHDFSRWLRARAEFGLATRLRPRLLQDFPSVEELRRSLVRDVDRYRRERARGSVNPFRPESFDGEEGLVQIGGGSLGGKGRGLAFASRLLDEVHLSGRFPGVRIAVPPAVVLGTEIFQRFLEGNGLAAFALESRDEEEVLARMLAAPLPADVVSALERVVEVMRAPLAVRSSSLLEDSPRQPFAGIYGTWLLPNDHPDPAVRLRHLIEAVKRVYASTFSRRARVFLDATPYRLEEEAMAVVVQKVVGRRHGGRFYPDISGVARSHNYYPVPPARTEDGIAAVALGLGKTVAEGEPCLRFSPAHPARAVDSSPGDMLDRSQRAFWALRLGGEEEAGEGGEGDGEPVPFLRRFDLRAAAEDGTLAPVASTWSAANDRIYDGLGRPGVPLVTFAPVLKHRVFPLAEILREVLVLGMSGTRLPVEVEFAVTLPEDPEGVAEFGFLQLRPFSRSQEESEVSLDGISPEAVVCESPSVLGHGRVDGLTDWIVVDQEGFERAESAAVADTVARLNRRLGEEGRPFGLIGVGRWGSSDPWLGIPVAWEDIAGARIIVEAGFRDFRVTPSQGTHFYQNLVSLGVGFFTVNPSVGEGRVDWAWLRSRPAVAEEGCVRWLRFDTPAVAILDGRQGRGVILKPA